MANSKPTEIPASGCSEEGSFRKLFRAPSSTVCTKRGPALPPTSSGEACPGACKLRRKVAPQHGLKCKFSYYKWFLAGGHVRGQYFFFPNNGQSLP